MVSVDLFDAYGLFSIGGGYAALPLIKEQVVETNSWLTMTQFTDLITIAEMTPGPIAINAATFVGNQTAGIPGAIIATVGFIFPSYIIVSILAFVYYKYKNLKTVQSVLGGLRPAVVALIASAGVSILITAFWGEGGFSLKAADINYISAALFALSFFMLKKFGKNPIFVIIGSGVAGTVIFIVKQYLPLA